MSTTCSRTCRADPSDRGSSGRRRRRRRRGRRCRSTPGHRPRRRCRPTTTRVAGSPRPGPRSRWKASSTVGGVSATSNAAAPAFARPSVTLAGTLRNASDLRVAVPPLAPVNSGGQSSAPAEPAEARLATRQIPRNPRAPPVAGLPRSPPYRAIGPDTPGYHRRVSTRGLVNGRRRPALPYQDTYSPATPPGLCRRPRPPAGPSSRSTRPVRRSTRV